MAGGGITGKAFSLETLFHGRTTYAIEYYQREYTWGADEVRTLLTDFVEEFERTGSARRTRWTSPPEFFLGPFVYADEHNDRRFLVDGQQRFTTLHLIFLHLLRIAPDNAHRKTTDRLTFAVVAGYDGERTRFRVDIDERQRAMDALLTDRPFELRQGDSLTVQNMWRRSEQIADELPQLLDTEQHGRFVDWLLDRVVMVGIEAGRLNRAVLDAVPLVRDCSSAEELGAVLGAQLPQLDFDAILGFGLRGDNRAQVRYILARLTAYVQQAMDQENIIERYLAEERAWHIEHLFPDHPDWHPDLTPRQFRAVRNRIGGLGLLSAPDNTSVRDLPYEKKITWYRRHNALLAVLSPGYQQRNPALRKFRNSHRLEKLMHDFGPSPSLQEVVETRGQLYHALARHIWDPTKLGLTIPNPTQDEALDAPAQRIPAPPSRTPTSGRRTGLAALVASGRIRPGTRLHGIHRGTRHEAPIDETGRIWLDDAAKTATGLKRCLGWKFWHIDLTDGTDIPLGDFRDNSDLVAR
jgi:hypothetical protein